MLFSWNAVTVPLGKLGELDYRLTTAPIFGNEFIEAGFKVIIE